MFAYFEKEISWTELSQRTIKDSIQDDAAGLAAQLAYYFFLSLFPALLFLVALASFFPLYSLTDEMMRLLAPIAPAAVVRLLKDQLTSLSNSDDVGLLSIGLLMALWSSSAAMVSVIDAMNRAYDIEDSRPWWKRRIIAIALTIGLALFILTSFGLIVAGPWLADFLGRAVRARAGVHARMEDSPVAGRLSAGLDRVSDWSITSRPTPSRNGCGSPLARSQPHCCGSSRRWRSATTSSTSATTKRPTAPSARLF